MDLGVAITRCVSLIDITTLRGEVGSASVPRKSGARYETPFCACSGCSVMFLNASQFDANSTANPNVEAPPAVVTPMIRRR